MSKIKNGGLDQYGKKYGLNGIGGERVKACLDFLQFLVTSKMESDVEITATASVGYSGSL